MRRIESNNTDKSMEEIFHLEQISNKSICRIMQVKLAIISNGLYLEQGEYSQP